MNVSLETAESIVKCMADMEAVLCSSCRHCSECAGRVNEYCMARFADQAKVMCGGKIE